MDNNKKDKAMISDLTKVMTAGKYRGVNIYRTDCGFMVFKVVYPSIEQAKEKIDQAYCDFNSSFNRNN